MRESDLTATWAWWLRCRLARVGLDVPIETKLHAPNPRAEWVERPRLTGELTRTAARLVLVDAPAGFGKTTLVAQWRASATETRPFAWVSLDRGDNDPGRLWWYIVQRAAARLPRDRRRGHSAGTAGADPRGRRDRAAHHRQRAGRDPSPVVLVLDDYHAIKERSCHEQIAFLLVHLPPSAQIVLITRADPPLPLARLRAAGEMVEIRARELRFDPGEAAALVHTVTGIRLAEPDLADLMERTEGWPAGVYLAALSLRGHPSPHAFVRQFSGDNRFIVDFLADEVLSRQPGEIQQFLARTSMLTRFCAPLCDAVTGSANAAEIIETLERENLFLVPLDDNRQWYRYHHLFAQLLRSQLSLDRARPRALAAPARERLAPAAGSTEEAVSHALAAGDADAAVDLIARHWYAYVGIGRTATVREWMRQLGDDRIAADPLAAHCAAWAAALTGDRETVRRWLPVIETGTHEGPLPDGMQSLRSSAAMLRAVFGFEGIAVMRESAATAVAIETDPASPYYALARAALGFSLYLGGDPQAAAGPAGGGGAERGVHARGAHVRAVGAGPGRGRAGPAGEGPELRPGRLRPGACGTSSARCRRAPWRTARWVRSTPRGDGWRRPAPSWSRPWNTAGGCPGSPRGRPSNPRCSWPRCSSPSGTARVPRNWRARRGTC